MNDQTISRLTAQNAKICNVKPRNRKEIRLFRKFFPCPSTGKHTGSCPGWVVDHIHALKHCGIDKSTNMAWQTVEDSKLKDRWE